MLPDLDWLTKMVVDCISGETAPLRAALAVALDEIAALKAQRGASPTQIVNFMNPHVAGRAPANDAARRGARRPLRPADGVGKAACAPRNAPIHASAVNFTPHRREGEEDHTLCTEPTFDSRAGRVYRRGHE